MPLVVRELVIRATLAQEEKKPEEGAEKPAVKRERLISECTDQVLAMLNEREER
ncbi:DUF5908 family protein [Kordiimonas lacus]|uniref:Uncharacterized protein n=1 Tax=Kordiimonas lacus TaxID=637679 RepID=A0A1G7A3V6_9PROT|nr:DUF5908 family protein [Kordiimonas lacus]SDE09584.1 hypothetical protein SAMN04488071_2079 [Kordiimonas lacus]